jgi:3'-phosphoadenosine 5'-phosphosulfate (PAPS) 3'-phosphatase
MRLVSELRVALQSVRLAAAATQLAAEQMLGAKSLIVQKTADKSPVTGMYNN